MHIFKALLSHIIVMKCHWHSVYSRRRQSASSMATKRQSVDCRKREALAMATKHQSADYREGSYGYQASVS